MFSFGLFYAKHRCKNNASARRYKDLHLSCACFKRRGKQKFGQSSCIPIRLLEILCMSCLKIACFHFSSQLKSRNPLNAEWTFFCDCLSQICQFKQVQNLGRLSKITHKLRWVAESARLGAFVNINSDNFIFYLFSSSHGSPDSHF